MKKDHMLLLCTQNSARSQMAEAFFKIYGGDLIKVDSAGLEPAGVNPYAVRVMAEIGIDISGQRSKGVKEFLGKASFSHIITVCKKAEGQCPTIFPGVRHIISWPFDDPAAVEGTEEEKLEKFREVRDEIDAHVEDFMAKYRRDETRNNFEKKYCCLLEE